MAPIFLLPESQLAALSPQGSKIPDAISSISNVNWPERAALRLPRNPHWSHLLFLCLILLIFIGTRLFLCSSIRAKPSSAGILVHCYVNVYQDKNRGQKSRLGRGKRELIHPDPYTQLEKRVLRFQVSVLLSEEQMEELSRAGLYVTDRDSADEKS